MVKPLRGIPETISALKPLRWDAGVQGGEHRIEKERERDRTKLLRSIFPREKKSLKNLHRYRIDCWITWNPEAWGEAPDLPRLASALCKPCCQTYSTGTSGKKPYACLLQVTSHSNLQPTGYSQWPFTSTHFCNCIPSRVMVTTKAIYEPPKIRKDNNPAVLRERGRERNVASWLYYDAVVTARLRFMR